jgi:CubicO group peptidase (beta-lactamase class C family)
VDQKIGKSKSAFGFIIVQLFLATFYPIKACSQKTEAKAIKTIDGKTIAIADFEKYLSGQMDSLKIPGLSIAIINSGSIVYSRNMGVKNVVSKEPAGPGTIFEACSLSKPIFAYFTLLMAARQALDIDTPLYRYYMDREVDFSDQVFTALTGRMVLNHASGWPNWRDNKAQLLKFNFMPGTRSGYSGEGYQHLKRVLNYRLSTDDYHLNGYFQEAVVEPLHIRSMNYTWLKEMGMNKAFGHIKGRPTDNGPHGDPRQFDAASSLHTDAEGYAKFIVKLMDTTDAVGNRLLQIQDQLPTEGDGLFRSLGFPYKLIDNEIRYYHSGDNGDARAYCHFYRNHGIGIVMFCNSDNFFSSGFAKKVLAFLDEPYPY